MRSKNHDPPIMLAMGQAVQGKGGSDLPPYRSCCFRLLGSMCIAAGDLIFQIVTVEHFLK
jgi:hypothetical protein